MRTEEAKERKERRRQYDRVRDKTPERIAKRRARDVRRHAQERIVLQAVKLLKQLLLEGFKGCK